METLRMVVTVKAYPAVGKKHGEAVCVAGIDATTPRWIRLYPVHFRDLPNPNRFRKWETVEVPVRKASDPRPESHMPDTDALRVVRPKLAAGKALERRRLIEPMLQPSMCTIRRRREADGTSLGVFRQVEILDLEVQEDRTPWRPDQQMRVDQSSMLMPGKTSLEKIPYQFRYVYRCEGESSCQGHRQSIIDWEIGQAFRRWRDEHENEARAVELVRQKWGEHMWSGKFDTFLFTGNQHDNPDGFLVLGVFWPTKLAATDAGRSRPGQAELLPPR